MMSVMSLGALQSIRRARAPLLLLVTLCYGPGRLSLDHWLRRRFLAAAGDSAAA